MYCSGNRKALMPIPLSAELSASVRQKECAGPNSVFSLSVLYTVGSSRALR